jgi:hypothetical protein
MNIFFIKNQISRMVCSEGDGQGLIFTPEKMYSSLYQPYFEHGIMRIRLYIEGFWAIASLSV